MLCPRLLFRYRNLHVRHRLAPYSADVALLLCYPSRFPWLSGTEPSSNASLDPAGNDTYSEFARDAAHLDVTGLTFIGRTGTCDVTGWIRGNGKP